MLKIFANYDIIANLLPIESKGDERKNYTQVPKSV